MFSRVSSQREEDGGGSRGHLDDAAQEERAPTIIATYNYICIYIYIYTYIERERDNDNNDNNNNI